MATTTSPAWAPATRGRARIVGVPEVGNTVTCDVDWIVKPTRDLDYSFVIDGYQKQEGERKTFRLLSAYAGKEVSCTAGGATIGGRGGPPGLAPGHVVRRADR